MGLVCEDWFYTQPCVVSHLRCCLFLTFFNSDKPILFPEITYSFYPVWADLYKIPYKTPSLDKDFHLVKEDYYEENGGIIFPNPNAPTSVMEELDVIDDIIDEE